MRVTPLSLLLILLTGGALSLGGCASAVVGGAAVTGVAIAQERSIGAAIDDQTIQLSVNSNLFQKDEALFRRIDVKVIEGRVLLTGPVPSADDRIEAARLAWKVNGVKAVMNEVQVTDSSGIIDYAKDAWVTAQLRTKVLSDQAILDINYSIETVNGVVYLMGIAQDQAELTRITDYARNIRGVIKVVSHVRLKDDPERKS